MMRGARPGRAAALVAASVALILLPAVPASAHNFVVATTPAEGSTVTEQPGTVSLTTNDVLLDFGENTIVQVVGPDGRHYETACAVVDEATAAVPAELGPAGEYTVVWQVVSTDGHPISGEFAFDWAPAEGLDTGIGSDASPCAAAADADGGGGGGSDTVSPSAEPATPTPAPLGDVLWIAGGGIAVVAAALATWLMVRRRGE